MGDLVTTLMASIGRVCVVGANGFIGSHIVKDLVSNNFSVVATTRKAPEDERVAWLKSLATSCSREDAIDIVQADPVIPGSLDKPLENCQGCIIAFGLNDPAYAEWVDEMVSMTKNVAASLEQL